MVSQRRVRFFKFTTKPFCNAIGQYPCFTPEGISTETKAKTVQSEHFCMYCSHRETTTRKKTAPAHILETLHYTQDKLVKAVYLPYL